MIPGARKAFSKSGMVICVLLLGCLLFAGGPQTIGPNGQVFKWNSDNPDTFPVRFIVDNGPLGPLTREEGAELVREAFARWADVPLATIEFQDLGFLNTDLTGANYETFFGQERPENPIVFDEDGSIIDDVLGEGSSESVLGFAGTRSLSPSTLEFRSAWAVLNGLKAEKAGVFPAVVAHEIGHLIGLDHTQINTRLAFSVNPADNKFVPLMFPFVVEEGPQGPIRDDIAWLSWLYPAANFRATTATLAGQIFRRSGGAFAGSNVVAVKVTQNPDQTPTESQDEIVSVVSDFLMKGDGSYELPGLIPGDYVVFIEPLNGLFTEGSSVGPFDSRFTSFPKDYYNRENESGTDADNPEEKIVITLAAGEMVAEINLVSNDPVNQLDLLTDDSEIIFEFPEGFSFPFFGKVYQQVVVNSDGNLTFEQGDSASTPRNESRFLSGPPRIAPLFTDLDPGEGGEVRASIDQGRITFTWENVPEFSDSGTPPGNSFSVTLFATGDILFGYDTVGVTPDPPDNTQIVVGVSPGGLSEGTSADLSSKGGLLRLAGAPVYEVFKGTSFDLNDQRLLFQASTSELLFPFYQGDGTNFSGYAVTNFSSDASAPITVEARGGDGVLLNNPGFIDVAPGNQVAKLGREFFGLPLSTAQSGWMRMASPLPDLASFFQFGNGLSGSITRMDGSVAFTGQSQVLFFTRIFDGPATFPTFGTLTGPQDAKTFVAIANPNNEPITLLLKLFGANGQPIGEASTSLPPLGRIFQTVVSLFPSLPASTQIGDGYLRVDVTGPGAVGFALIQVGQDEDTLLGVNASFGTNSGALYSAQLANGADQGRSIFTSIKLVNTSSEPKFVTITGLREDGSTIGTSPFTLNPNISFQRSVHEIFPLGAPTTSELTVGSIRITVEGAGGVVGDVIFGDPGDPSTGTPNKVDFAAALPLQTQLFRKAIFSHVVKGATKPSDPSTNAFTGIALFNPNNLTAQVSIRVLDRNGTDVGQTTLNLRQNERLSRLIEELVPQISTLTLIGGYIVIESDQPIVAQQLFGNATLQFLSAVPPRIIQ